MSLPALATRLNPATVRQADPEPAERTIAMRPAFLFFATACPLALFTARAEAAPPKPAEPPVNYSRDIKPFLTGRCYACHGPDEGQRKAKLRLDVRASAIKKAIKPGNSAESPLIQRISSDKPDQVMPPPKAKKEPLTKAQIELLRRWIDQGAKFDIHWAYVKPARAPLPEVKDKKWPRNAIDRFIAAEQDKRGYRPAAEADRITLIRRLSFDLTGLPPTPAQVTAFVNDKSPEAYEKVVGRLLASPQYGERMAMYWLDLVRFADTGGYHSDNHRDITLYRDYVIKAFNENKRFDQFTIEQLAGDLLPKATTENKIASGYNRLLMTTEEGGAQAKEYLAKYAADRVRNASTVWLAGTLGCAECHNHKFDPYTTKDFYSFAAFFADLQEVAVGRQPETPIPTPAQAARLAKVEEKIRPLTATLAKQTPELDAAQAAWEKSLKPEQIKLLPRNIAAILAIEAAKRNDSQKQALAAHYRSIAPLLEAVRKELAELQRQKAAIDKTIPRTLVSTTTPPRMMRILPRGNWMDDSGKQVTPAVPEFLANLENKDRATRLDLAQWLTSPDNPVVARVFVNRLWKLMFGQGLVKSLDDFGTQGALPTHPQLLDWLAAESIASGWDVKHMVKLMAMSTTYRQSSHAAKELRERDPGNQWLARQNRFRLDAEMVRDNALAISGLLSLKIGGPSVKPYQPDGYWQYLNFPVRVYHNDHGEDLYRRGLYTYWQRTLPHPSLTAFDAPSREECTVERPRSSTPLQALVLLNDPTYVEAARALAERIIKDGGNTLAERLGYAYRHALSRDIRPAEQKVLVALYEKHLGEYREDQKAAEKLVKTGERPLPKEVDLAELAAWTSVARAILNLHETITRE
jgi:hypothetical protein